MRHGIITFLCVLFVGLIFSGCNSVAEPIEVEMQVNLEQNDAQQFKVNGTTNLPDGMELMIDVGGPFNYLAQDKLSVFNGTIESEWFGDHENPDNQLNAGEYIVEISSPIASVQPSMVKKKIGKDGIMLKGKYIIQEQSTGNRLKYDTSVMIEGVNHRHLFADKVVKLHREDLIEKLKKEFDIDFVTQKQDDGTPEAEAKIFDWANIFLVGDPNDLKNVSVQLKEITDIQTIYIWKTLQIVFPEWEDAYTWTIQAIQKVTTIGQGTNSEVIYYGNKGISIIYSADLGYLTMLILPLE